MDQTSFTIISSQLTEFERLLQQSLQQLGINLTVEQQYNLLQYLDKLLFWNKAYNLTAIKQPKEALIKHVFDCLAIIPHLKSGRLLDIGTGAGLPGIIVAICQPERRVTVLDSNQKKIRFIKQLISDLALPNVTPVASRIEHFNPEGAERFDVITSRAFASLTDFVNAAAPRMADDGYLQAMKGLVPDTEDIKAVELAWHLKVIPMSVPHLNDTRHLVELTRK